MAPYWFLFLFFAIGALLTLRGDNVARSQAAGLAYGQPQRVRAEPVFFLAMLLVTLMIGLRFEVGGDWFNYLRIFNRTRLLDFSQLLTSGDPAYQLLNWLAGRAGAGIWLVNLLCAAIFCWGLGRFLRTQPWPWLGMVVAVPYLVIVVGMGLTRQAAALGLVMAGLAAVLRGGGMGRFAFLVILAALFHKTAIVALPLLAFVFPRSRGSDLLLIGGVVAGLYVLLIQGSIDTLQRNYIAERLASQGAAIRLAQLAVAAVAFFVIRRAAALGEKEGRMWRNFALVALALIPVLILSPSSTAVDRLSLYLMPMQIAVLSRVPQWLTNPVIGRMLVIAYSALVLFVWLNYAVHSGDWVPYRTILDAPEIR